MLDEFAAYLRDMYKSVLVDTDINEYTEIDDIADCSHKLHTGLEVLYLHDIAASHKRRRELVTEVTAGLFKLSDDICESWYTYAEGGAYILNSEAVSLLRDTLCTAVGYVCKCESALAEE